MGDEKMMIIYCMTKNENTTIKWYTREGGEHNDYNVCNNYAISSINNLIQHIKLLGDVGEDTVTN